MTESGRCHDQCRHRHGAIHRDGRGQRRPAPAGGGGAGTSGGVITATMVFLEEKGCVSWDISAAPRRSGRSTMATNPNSMVQEAVDAAISKRGEIGLQVVAYVDGKQVVDVWGGLADITTGRQVDADTLFPVFSVTKAVTAGLETLVPSAPKTEV